MREFILILLFAGCFYFVAKQFAMNIALVFEDKKEERKIIMREILFRGKSADNGEWIEGCGIIATEQWASVFVVIVDLETNSADIEEYEVIPKTVGQFTGLTDKNGKKIFEGDILKSERFDTVGVVVSNEWNCSCCVGVFGYCLDGYADLRDYKLYEVIGNIHDNIELLKGGD